MKNCLLITPLLALSAFAGTITYGTSAGACLDLFVCVNNSGPVFSAASMSAPGSYANADSSLTIYSALSTSATAYGALSSSLAWVSAGAGAEYTLNDQVSFFGGTGAGFIRVMMQFDGTRQGTLSNPSATMQFGSGSLQSAGQPNPYGSLTVTVPITFGQAVALYFDVGASAAGGERIGYGSANATMFGQIQVQGVFDGAGNAISGWNYGASQAYSTFSGGTFIQPIPEPAQFISIAALLMLLVFVRIWRLRMSESSHTVALLLG